MQTFPPKTPRKPNIESDLGVLRKEIVHCQTPMKPEGVVI